MYTFICRRCGLPGKAAKRDDVPGDTHYAHGTDTCITHIVAHLRLLEERVAYLEFGGPDV